MGGKRGELSQPLLGRTEQVEHAVAILQSCARMLGRRVGHEKEDKHFDKLMRMKDLHILVFSMLGVVAMVAMDVVPWYASEKRVDTKYKDADEMLKTVYLSLQLVISLSTLIVVALLVQYYNLLLFSKQREWSGGEVVVFSPGTRDQKSEMESSYSLLASPLKWGALAEVVIHVFHPIVFLQETFPALYSGCKVVMLLRLYLIFRVVHTHSTAYKDRFEIINHCEEFRTMNLRLKQSMTLKIILYNRTALVVALWAFLTVLLGGFGMFLVERHADIDEPWVHSDIGWAGDMESCLWFAFVTATTIGYGDFWPATLAGRLMTCFIGCMGLGVLIVFQGLLTNQLAPTRTEKYIKEYLTTHEAFSNYAECAAILIQRVWRYREAKKRYPIPVFHKCNTIFGAMKRFRVVRFKLKHAKLGSLDPVLEEKLEELMWQANEVGWVLQSQQDALLALHRRINRALRNARHVIQD